MHVGLLNVAGTLTKHISILSQTILRRSYASLLCQLRKESNRGSSSCRVWMVMDWSVVGVRMEWGSILVGNGLPHLRFLLPLRLPRLPGTTTC